MKRILLGIMTAATLVGCSSSGFKPTADIGEVSPSYVASGRTKDVTVRGQFTKWKASTITAANVSFGAGITVNSVTVADETFLKVNITAAPNAALGVRDVTIDKEVLTGVFEVKAPFVVQNATVHQGDIAVLNIVGTDTDWLQGLTQIQNTEGDIITAGNAILPGVTLGANVYAPNFMQAIVEADLFAAAGPRGLVINGIQITDTVPDAITMANATVTNLSASVSSNVVLTDVLESKIYKIPTGAVGDVRDLAFDFGIASPFGAIFSSDDGLNPIGGVYDVNDFFFGEIRQDLLDPVFDTSKDLYVIVWDYNLGGGDTNAFGLRYTKNAAASIVTGTPKTGETLAAATSQNFYLATATNKWSLLAFTETPTGASMLDGQVVAMRKGATGPTFSGVADSGFSGDPETLVTIAGHNLKSFFAVNDYDGTATGAGNPYDASITENTIPGTIVDSQDVNLPLVDNGEVTSVVTIASTTVLAGDLHVMLDIDHTYISDLTITLQSPMGSIAYLFDGSGGSSDGLIEAFPDTRFPYDDLASAFDGEDPSGDWTLTVTDTYPGDSGVLNGWAIATSP